MKQALIGAYLLSVIAFVSCTGGDDQIPGLTAQQRKKIESDVTNRFNAMIKYSEAGELENVLSHFVPSGPGTYIDEGTRHASLEEMLGLYRATWRVRSQDYGTPDTRVYVLSPAFAVVTSSSTLTTVNREGVEFEPRPWTITTLWTLNEGEWQIHSFQQFSGPAKPVEQEEKDPD
jgi:hypothetical protein